jgi:hypothetical protein
MIPGVLGVSLLGLALGTACSSPDPCRASSLRLLRRESARYVGAWTVTRGDTLTLPQLGDRFQLATVRLDTAPVAVGATCRLRGAISFREPRAETLAVTWTGGPEALLHGWPADLGPFGGLGLVVAGDSLRGALLFDSRLGITVRPGLTAQFVASRALAR